MKLFAQLLLLTTALLAAPACSKDDSRPVVRNEGRYTIDRREVAAAATYSTQTGGTATGADDLLYIQLQNKASRTELLEVIFAKAPNAAESTYRPLSLRLTDSQGFTSIYQQNLTMTVSRNGNGYSGTFAGARTLPASTGGGSSLISGGEFTNVQ